MKYSVAVLAILTSLLTDSAVARGGTGKSKSSSTSSPSCECDGPVSLETRFFAQEQAQLTPVILTISDAVSRTPENCVLKTPDMADVMIAPTDGVGGLVPIVKDPALILNCIPDDSGPTGCRSNWFFLDGTPVPNDAATWASAQPNQGMVFTSDGVQFETFQQTGGSSAPFTAYYACCLTAEGTCLDLVMAEESSTSTTGKTGKSRRRG